MQVKKLLTALFIGLSFTLAVMAGLSLPPVEQANAQGTIYYVDDAVGPATGSGTELDPYCRVQDAVGAAGDDDEIRVAGGTYTGAQLVLDSRTGYTYTQVVFISESLTLRGGYDAGDWNADPDPTINPTVIDAQRQGRGVSIVGISGGEPAVTVDGFTITGGDYTGLGDPTNTSNRVCYDVGDQDCGGGLYTFRSALTLRNSIISDNVVGTNRGHGGGIYLWQAHTTHIENTTIISNSTMDGRGGGIYGRSVYSPITITHSTFENNYATGRGGGLMLIPSSFSVFATILDTDFLGNTATSDAGGACIHLWSAKALRMERVRFQDNQANDTSAALLLATTTASPQVRLSNLVLGGNRLTSAAVDADDAVISVDGYAGIDLTLAHVTAADNQAPTFLYAESHTNDPVSVTLTNTLVVSFTNGFAAHQDEGETVVIRHTNTLTQDVTMLHQAVGGTPTFQAINPLSGDPKLDATYHLVSGSAAIDAGVDADVDHDIDGQARPYGSAPDIGADEFVPIPPTGVSISGPPEGLVGESYTFVATPIPPTATTPITYTWSPTPTTGQGTDIATYSWTTPGTKTLTVLLENFIGTVLVPGAHTIYIRDYRIYLPLVIRDS